MSDEYYSGKGIEKTVLIVAAAIFIVVGLIVTVMFFKKTDVDQIEDVDGSQAAASATLYFHTGSKMQGSELIDGMSKLKGFKVRFKVVTLANSISYYNYDGDEAKEIPSYSITTSGDSPDYIYEFGLFSINVENLDGYQLVTAIQQK